MSHAQEEQDAQHQRDLLDQLDREFSAGESMTIAVWKARHEEIIEKCRARSTLLKQMADERRQAEAAAPLQSPAAAERLVTKLLLRRTIDGLTKALTKAVREHVKAPLLADIKKLQERISQLESLATRLAAVEMRTGALSMTLGRRLDDTEPDTSRLELRIAELEKRQMVQYGGIWREGKEHQRGTLITDRGTLWFCHTTTRARPGTTDDWQLMAKSTK
jgi:hypothetical protein